MNPKRFLWLNTFRIRLVFRIQIIEIFAAKKNTKNNLTTGKNVMRFQRNPCVDLLFEYFIITRHCHGKVNLFQNST